MYTGTTTALTSGSTYTSASRMSDRYDTIAGTVFADQAGTLHIEQSSDGTNWDVDTSYAITASDGKGFTEAIVAPFWRIRYVNGGTNQGTFRLHARTIASGDS